MSNETFFEYHIPDYITELIDKKFLLVFGNNLIKQFETKCSLKQIVEEEIGSSEWVDAFHIACDNTANAVLWDYYYRLEWSDVEIFDEELRNLLYENKIINVKE